MSSFRDSDFDNLISQSLKGAFGQAEPSPAVWESIQSQIVSSRQGPRSHSPLRGLVNNIRRSFFGVERYFFSGHIRQERLTEQRALFLANLLACPSTNSIPLAVV